MSEKTTALFFARCPPGQMDALRAQLDKVIETLRLP
jgi:hypothetical protein